MVAGSEDDGSVPLVSPRDAWQLLQDQPGAVLIDVRSDMEFLMIGHPEKAINVPWIDAPDWTINQNFVSEVRKVLLGRVVGRKGSGQPPVLLICRSGNRSRDAARTLQAGGVSQVQIVDGGFEGPLDEHHHRNSIAGWRHAALPWVQC